MKAILTLFAGLAFLAACGLTSEELPTYRYKTIVEVETPDGMVSGYAITEKKLATQPEPRLPEMGKTVGSYSGEAVAIDLPNGQTLFALLKCTEERNGCLDWTKAVPPERIPGWLSVSDDEMADLPDGELYDVLRAQLGALAKAKGISGELPLRFYPMFVRFRDVNDPASVEEVNPEDLSASFGPGYRIKRVVIEFTDEPFNDTIRQRLTWLGNFPEPRLDPEYKGSKTPNFSQILTHGDFVTRARK